MKKQNSKLPLTTNQYYKIINIDPVIDVLLKTGLRASEAAELFNKLSGESRVLIKRKGGKLTPVYLNSDVLALRHLGGFGEQNGDRFKINRHIKRVLAFHNLNGDITAHNFRATYATRLIERGVDLVTIQTLMNHRDISTTSQYIKINEEGLSNAVSVLEDNVEGFEGMTIPQLKKEILRLRNALKREESNETK